MRDPVLTPSDLVSQVRRRTRRDPRPRFKPDQTAQLDAVMGCPALSVPSGHVAHVVREAVERLDLSAVEAQYSSLGRHGYHPRHKLGVLILGSLVGVHHSTEMAQRLRTDAAFRLVAGGHPISAGRLRAFRRENAVLFADCIEQVVAMAVERGLVSLTELAVDGMRLRAHAPRQGARTAAHAKKRVEELAAVDAATLSAEERQKHEAKLARHRETIQACEQSGRTSIVSTNPSAALMKFPTGMAAPGHRITVTAAGVKARLVISVLVDADTNDYGKLGPALEQARAVLLRAGVPPGEQLQATADAGYTSEADLAFAESNRSWVDVLTRVNPKSHADSITKERFGRDRFTVLPDGKMQCPAGTTMHGPIQNGDGRLLFRGVGCGECALRPQCTGGKRRIMVIAPRLERLRHAMLRRLEEPGALERYHQRMATVEPVFAHLQDTMKFRRASSRHADAVVAEILLKILAHNIARLAVARPAAVVVCELEIEF